MYSFIFPEVQGYVSLPLSVVAGQTGRPSYHSTFQTNYNSCPLWTRICALMTHSSTVTTITCPVTRHHSRHRSRNVQWELPMTDLRKVSTGARGRQQMMYLYCLAQSSHLFHSFHHSMHSTAGARETRSHRGKPESTR